MNKSNNEERSISAVDLILDMLTTLDEDYLSLSSLKKAGAVCGIDERSIRVALTRLTSQSKIEKVKRGHYRAALFDNFLQHSVRTWLDREKQVIAWNYHWIGICDANIPRSNRKVLRSHQRALSIKGFKEAKSGLHLRPNNLSGGLYKTINELESLGLAKDAGVFEISKLSSREEYEALHLWDTEKLVKRYDHILKQLSKSENKLKLLNIHEQAKETLLVGREAISKVVRDPLLPVEICEDKTRRLLITKLSGYQLKAKKLWEDLILD